MPFVRSDDLPGASIILLPQSVNTPFSPGVAIPGGGKFLGRYGIGTVEVTRSVNPKGEGRVGPGKVEEGFSCPFIARPDGGTPFPGLDSKRKK